ncbi:two component transcriptional regulator, LuxR family [Paracoccus alcaliphilus]|uniref:Two component transcriptional regulator, LuxR family n=1 Tax=Paracoccus alcaliphilus TaxID=34002 RepID=A0A1H8IFY5_9RHOB|nr:response regulator [Paracoccus alcaliphilus]WCR19125.1 response regulator transcription factor [Paracoccus alcaliphilus]SEN67271.1 two component transcriptional regulator, LuxR family [Paracoccus alcaliphilus]
MTERPHTVFIVDDDDAIRGSLSRALGKRGYDVQSFASAQDFLDAYDGGRPGCLILDQGMPGMTGLQLQDHLLKSGHGLPIIFITGHGGVPESVQAVKRGAIDFLEKPFRQTVLIERIEAALELARNQAETDAQNRRLLDRFGRLTARELEIVRLILADPSAISSKDIGRRLDISPRTVDHHRARILEKLEISSVVELVDMARRTDLDRLCVGEG